MKVLKSRKCIKPRVILTALAASIVLSGCNPVKDVGAILYYEVTGNNKYLIEEPEKVEPVTEEIKIKDEALLESLDYYDITDASSRNRVINLKIIEPDCLDETFYFKNLGLISIYGGNINSLEFAEYLPALNFLYINNCQNIIKLDELANTSISVLVLNSLNNVDNYEVLNNMKELRSLDIIHCKNFNIDEITNPNITSLSITDVSKDDLTFLSKFENLTLLNINNSSISSLKGIDKLKNLETLVLDNCLLTDVSELYKLPNLKYISIRNNSVDEIDLSKFPNLIRIAVEQNFKLYNKEFYNYCINHNIKTDIKAKDIELMDEIREMINNLNLENLSLEEKSSIIYDYVISFMEYDVPGSKDIYQSLKYNEEALDYAVTGKGVCINYAYLLDAMYDEVGIDAFCITGYGKTSKNEGGGHAWNLVKYDDVYRLSDVTWSDSDDEEKRNIYYEVTGEETKEFNKSHLESVYDPNIKSLKVRSRKANN